jgi:YfiH family protein
MALIRPAWEAPARVQALVTTRALGDMASPEGKARLAPFLPGEPCWLKQVHGTRVVAAAGGRPEADAAFTRELGRVCAVMAADCMPVLFADRAGTVVAAAHAGWRGLCAGVLEETVAAIGVAPAALLAWLGPAIGPRAYEVGDEVRKAFVARDARGASAFIPARPGHWMLDLYAVARQRLAAAGVVSVSGGGACTHGEQERFFSYRRDGTKERMAALIWLT